MMSNHDDRPGGSRLLLGAGAALLTVVCCALPVLIAAGALAGVGGFLDNPWVIGAGMTVLVLALLAPPCGEVAATAPITAAAPPMKTTHPAEMKDDQRR